MLLKTAVFLAAFLLGQSSAMPALEPRQNTTALEGTAACKASQTQPFVFKGALVIKGAVNYGDTNVKYLVPGKAYNNKTYLYLNDDITKLYPNNQTRYEGVIATPCDNVRPRVVYAELDYANVDAVSAGILKRRTNPSQCLKMIVKDRKCSRDEICNPRTAGNGYADNYYGLTGTGYNTRWAPCPKTDGELVDAFFWAWAYNSTGQTSGAGRHPRVFVHRANEINSPRRYFSDNGYSLGNRWNGAPLLVGSVWKAANRDVIQLVSAYDGNATRTAASIASDTEPDYFGF